MMTISSLNTPVTRLNSGFISSAEEALNIVSSIQFFLADNIRSSLGSQIVTGDRLIEKILSVSDLLGRVKNSTSGPFNPVTPEKLKNSVRTAEELSKLFLNDGPRLGNTISEGQEILDKLLGVGADVEVNVLYPVLTEVKNSDGILTSSSFEWFTQAQLTNLQNKNLTSSNSDFPGAVSFSIETDSTSTTITSFESFAILRPDLLSISDAFPKIGEVVLGCRNELAGLIANLSRAAYQLEGMIERAIESGKSLEQRQTENSEKGKSDLIELLRNIYRLKIEKFKKDDLRVDPDISMRASENNEFKSDTEISTKASENSADPDK